VLPSTAVYKQVLHGPHKRVAYIDAYDIDGVLLAQSVPIINGSVRADLNNRVTRLAEFELTDDWYPRTPTSPFSPFLAVARIRAGVQYGNGLEETFPIFTGRVADVNRLADGAVRFRADDLASDVLAYRFEQPEVSNQAPFSGIVAEIHRLILQAVPQATFGTNDVTDSPVPPLVWDEDRGQALDDLSGALGARWYTLGNGDFVLRMFNYTPTAPLQQILDGPSGLMSTASTTQTRDGSANSIVVVSERLDGSGPIRVIQRDTSPSSPTRFGGKYGRVSQVIKVQTPLTNLEAQTLARTQLAASLALSEQWSVECVPDHTLEPGDTVRLGYRGLVADQIIDSMTYPLLTGTMSLSTRGSVSADVVGA
jgi:hypothetical protein